MTYGKYFYIISKSKICEIADVVMNSVARISLKYCAENVTLRIARSEESVTIFLRDVHFAAIGVSAGCNSVALSLDCRDGEYMP